jgi:hypothetical protein
MLLKCIYEGKKGLAERVKLRNQSSEITSFFFILYVLRTCSTVCTLRSSVRFQIVYYFFDSNGRAT